MTTKSFRTLPRQNTQIWWGIGLFFCSVTAPVGAYEAMNQLSGENSPVSHTIYFGFADDRVTPDEQKKMVNALDGFRGSDQPVQVVGFTDSIGFQAYNDDLARRRADSVRDVLREAGISDDRILASGLGRTKYVGDNATEVTRKLNRRVEISLSERRLRSIDGGARRRASDDPLSARVDPRRAGRYLQLATTATRDQADPLQTLITVSFPPQVSTIGAALDHLLVRSGWRWASAEAGDPSLPARLGLSLPESQRSLGPIVLLDALSVLCGDVYTVVLDPVHRLVSCELREPYAQLVSVESPPAPAKLPTGDEADDKPDTEH